MPEDNEKQIPIGVQLPPDSPPSLCICEYCRTAPMRPGRVDGYAWFCIHKQTLAAFLPKIGQWAVLWPVTLATYRAAVEGLEGLVLDENEK